MRQQRNLSMNKETTIKKIPPLKIYFSSEDKKEILVRIEECPSSGMLAQGKNVKEFEDEFAKYIDVKNAVAVNSGGSAIEISMRILNVKDKEVLVPANTFFATASSVILAGGNPVFVDISKDTFSISLEHLKKSKTKNTVGVIVVHIGGIITPEIESIKKWCDDNGLWLFEDCAHAHGSRLNGKMAGTFGIAGGYSFFATKVMTSGEGGMLVTNNNDFAKKAKILRDYGKTEPWVSFHTEIGANCRMSDISGVIGLVQLRKLDEFVNWREKVASLYTNKLKSLPGIKLILPKDKCSWYKYIVLLPSNIDREKLRIKMKEIGVSLSGGVYDLPLHKQPVFKNVEAKDLKNTEEVCSHHICLPIYYGMGNEEVEYVINALKLALKD